MTPPDFALIVIGDEVLSGRRRDQHLPKWIELLGERGLRLAWAEYVGDDPARITQVLRRAFASGAAVVSSGGIGATPDDHTRQCAAAALGRPLQLHPQARALIEERMRDMARARGERFDAARPDNVHRLNMGLLPQGAGIIPNPFNKIPGFYCVPSGAALQAALPPGPDGDAPAAAASGALRAAAAGGCVFFVPGFPVMAWPMMAWALDTFYHPWFQRGAWQEKSVILLGATEATLTPVMQALEAAHPQIKVFSLPSVDHPEFGPHIDLGVKGPVQAVAAAYADLRARLAAFDLKYGPELVR
ncbi:MAG: competence/damage-inducible protein A [Burkholderiaceae bacterium]|jgi:molybdopterin-biosynthesis enzyme MoeA-like protein|nr:competence/damage-inducible protein A [Burkholderiaceae bacterium]